MPAAGVEMEVLARAGAAVFGDDQELDSARIWFRFTTQYRKDNSVACIYTQRDNPVIG